MKKTISFLMVMVMILSALNITAYSAEFVPTEINFSTGSAGDPLPGTVSFKTDSASNQAYALHETLDGTMCAAITDKDPDGSSSLLAEFGSISEGVVSVDVTVATSVLGTDLCSILASDGSEAARLRIKTSGEAVLVTDGNGFDAVSTGDTFPVNKLVNIKFTFDFDAKTVKLSTGDGFGQKTFSADDINAISFNTTKSGYKDKLWISRISVYQGEEKDTGLDPDIPTLYLIGDSTGSPYTSSDYYKNGGNYSVIRNGFGMAFGNYFDTSKINLVNYAVSGISSKSFMGNDNNAAMRSTWKAGDYLIIAFGHNDEKDSDEARFTNASMGVEGIDTEGQFANSLYANYIKPAQDAGVNVILATPIIRRSRVKDVVTGSDVHDLTDKGFGDYSQTVRDLAAKLDIPCIDNTQMTYNEYIALGKGPADGSDGYGAYHSQFSDDYMKTKEYFAEDGSLDENYRIDNTHLNSYGADVVSYFMAKAIKGDTETAVYTDNSKGLLADLAGYLKSTITDPRLEGKKEDKLDTEAAEGFSVYLDTETTLHDKLGETFDINVNVKDNKGISNISYTIDYDTDILQLVSPSVEAANGSILSEGKAAPELETADGTLATYTFKVVGGGDTDVTLDVKSMDYNGTAYTSDDYSVGSLSVVCDFNPETAN